MGVIRGGLLVIVSVLLFLGLLAGSIFLTLSWSLDYENVKTELVSVVKEIVEEEGGLETVEQEFEFIESYCENESEYVFKERNYTFVIPCEVVGEGQEAVVDYSVSSLVEQIYYEEYECGFWDCFKEQPFFLVSAKAKDYWNSKFYLALIASIILIILSFFLVEKKTNLPFILGGLLILSALLFVKLDLLFSFFGEDFSKLFSVFFSQSYSVFLKVLILGVIFLVVGIVLKFFKIGFKISNLFSKKDKKVSEEDVKDIVKKEVGKSKSEKKKKK